MKKLLLFTSAILVTVFSYAQDRNVEIPLEKNEEILDFVDLQEHGFILKTGKDKNYTKDLNWQLSRYSPQLELLWKVPIETTQMNKGLGEEIVASPTGSYVYHLENKGYNTTLGVNKVQLTQIANGVSKTHELESEELKILDGNISVKSCDEQYFYMIGIEKEDKDIPSHLFFHRFSHVDFSYSKKKVDLPLTGQDNSITSWEYAGHNNDNIWLTSKVISDKNYHCQLIAIDWQGNITKKIKLQTHVNEHYLRPSLNYHPQHRGTAVNLFGNITQYVNLNHPSGMAHADYTLGMDAWANVLVDEENKIIYTYGLYGKKKYRGRAAFVDGYYICGYDLEGNLLWKNISDETSPIAEDKLFRKRLLSHQRTTMATLTANNTIKFQIGSYVNIHTCEFSKDGKKIKEYKNEFKDGLNYYSFSVCFSPQSDANQYYYDHVSKKTSHYGYSSANGCILIEHEKNNNLSLLKW